MHFLISVIQPIGVLISGADKLGGAKEVGDISWTKSCFNCNWRTLLFPTPNTEQNRMGRDGETPRSDQNLIKWKHTSGRGMRNKTSSRVQSPMKWCVRIKINSNANLYVNVFKVNTEETPLRFSLQSKCHREAFLNLFHSLVVHVAYLWPSRIRLTTSSCARGHLPGKEKKGATEILRNFSP